MDDVLDYLYSPDRKRRIALFRRRGGSIGYREEYWYRNGFWCGDEFVALEGWAPPADGSSFYADLDTARREIPYAFQLLSPPPRAAE